MHCTGTNCVLYEQVKRLLTHSVAHWLHIGLMWQAEDLFHSIDTDGSGTLSITELEVCPVGLYRWATPMGCDADCRRLTT